MELRLKNISYKYPHTEKYALRNFSLNFKKGESTVILGKNGSGKSTLFYLSNGVLEAEEGEIFIDDLKIEKKNKKILRQRVGLVFQEPEMQFIAPSVIEEISFGPINMGLSDSEVKKRVERVIELLNISHLKNKSLYALSGGEKKMVSIASILSMSPDFILFDEPTAGVDYPNQLKFIEVLKILKKEGLGLIISTHDNDFAWEWGERAVIMKEGEVIDQGDISLIADKKIMNEALLPRPKLIDFADLLGLDTYPKTLREINLKN